MPAPMIGFMRPAAAPYVANAVVFDVTNDYLNRGADMTGNANSKLWTVSFWIYPNSTGVFQFIYFTGDTFGYIQRINTNAIEFIMKNAAGSTILNIITSVAVSSGAWHHVAMSVDLSDTGKRHLYVDGISRLTVNTYTDDTMDLTRPDHGIGATNIGGSKLGADLAEFQMWNGVYADLSVAGNMALLMSGGLPVNPAIAAATLGTPIILFAGPTSTWHTNQGSGLGFTENGALTDSSNLPVTL